MKPAPLSRAAKSVRGDRTPSRLNHTVWQGSPHIAESEVDARRLRLTPREREVLALLCEGLSNKLIGRRLKISAGTVKVHVSNILRALNVSNRLQAVVVARCWQVNHETDPLEQPRQLHRASHR